MALRSSLCPLRLCGEFDSLVDENWIVLMAIPFWFERPL